MVSTLATIGICAGIFIADRVYKLLNFDKSVSAKIRTEECEYEKVIEKPRKKHALIVLGEAGYLIRSPFENTSQLVYSSLLSRGYEKDNIFVLEGKNKPKNRFDCHNFPSDKHYLRKVCDHLSREITEEDSFFMYMLGHGGKPFSPLPFMTFGRSDFSLSKGEITELELEEILSDLNPNYGLLFFNSCYGGGFANRLGKGRNIGISVSRQDQLISSNPKTRKIFGTYASEFTLAFFSALKGQLPDGRPIEVEKNLEDVFDYAAGFDRENQMFGAFGRNTPHLVYGKINPREIKL